MAESIGSTEPVLFLYSDCDRRGDHPDLCGSARDAGSTIAETGGVPMAPTVTALVNQKGGVAKSTSCINLGASLFQEGKRVLLVDTDAHPLDETHFVFRLRTARSDLTQVKFYYADRADMSPELAFTELCMPLIRSDSFAHMSTEVRAD